jgi:hypothetical protein
MPMRIALNVVLLSDGMTEQQERQALMSAIKTRPQREGF